MKKNKLNKCKLAILICISALLGEMVPIAEISAAENTIKVDTVDLTSDESADLLAYLRTEISTYMDTFRISPEMPDRALISAYQALDSDEAESAWNQANKLLTDAEQLSAEDAESLSEDVNTKACLRFYDVMVRSNEVMTLATSNEIIPQGNLEGIEGIGGIEVTAVNESEKSSQAGTVSLANTTITATAASIKYTEGCTDYFETTITRVTLKNTNAGKATITYNDENQNLQNAPSSPFFLESGESATFEVMSPSGQEATTEGKFTFVSIVFDTINVTTTFAISQNGKYTITDLNGTNYEPGESVVNPSTMKYTVKATPDDGYKFLAWVDGNGTKLSTAESYDFDAKEITIVPKFIRTDSATYTVNGNLYVFLDEAIKAAGNNGTVIVASDGTVYAADGSNKFTIPAGVTLLIPFDAAGTSYTSEPVAVNSYTTPTPYRTLTMTNGTSISVEGTISVSGQHSAAFGYIGAPTGPQGFVVMQNGSSISVEKGGTLYAWGYIVGEGYNTETPSEGKIEIQSGATVYECFQVSDYRGGNVTNSMIDNTECVFPMSQYYMQNVQVPMTLYAGAKEKGRMSVSFTVFGLTSINSSEVPFIGDVADDNSMFFIKSGTVTKDYDEKSDRLIITVDDCKNGTEQMNGDAVIQNMKITIAVSGVNRDIVSSKYILPITNNISINVEGKSVITVNQNLSLLPGTVINISSEAKVNIGTGFSMYVYDKEQWGNYAYSAKFNPIRWAYAKQKTRTEKDLEDAKILVNGVLDATAGNLFVTGEVLEDGAMIGGGNIYSTGQGIVKCKQATDTTDTALYQVTQSDRTITYVSIPIKSAHLKNADGTYCCTIGATTVTDFTYSNGKWSTCTHGCTKVLEDKAATCTETGTEGGTECIHCGFVTVEPTVIPATGHTEVTDASVEPTCTENGLTEGKHCSVCNETIVEQKVIYASHAWPEEWTIDKEATATEDGIMHKTCTRANCEVKKIAHIPATGTKPDPQAGNVTVAVEAHPGAPVTMITNNKDELIGFIFDETEQNEINNNGQDADIWLEVKNIDENEVSSEHQTAIKDQASGTLGGVTDVMYLDVSLYKQIGEDEPKKISEPSDSIEVTIIVPEELLNVPEDYKREFVMVRMHDGVAEVITDGKFDPTTKEFTFTTNKFSTYALAYNDTFVERISVDITWDAMAFTYTKGTWNPSTHQYNPDTWEPTEKDQNKVAIANNSNIAINASLVYGAKTGYEDINGSLVLEGASSATTEPVLIAKNTTKKWSLILNGPLPEETEPQTQIGTITVTLGKEQ